jgi:hypothetical protein
MMHAPHPTGRIRIDNSLVFADHAAARAKIRRGALMNIGVPVCGGQIRCPSLIKSRAAKLRAQDCLSNTGFQAIRIRIVRKKFALQSLRPANPVADRFAQKPDPHWHPAQIRRTPA